MINLPHKQSNRIAVNIAAPLIDNTELETFIKERNEALLALDEERIRKLTRKYNNKELPTDPLVFWGAVHKAITGIVYLPIEHRRKSKEWLLQKGLSSHDDGDL